MSYAYRDRVAVLGAEVKENREHVLGAARLASRVKWDHDFRRFRDSEKGAGSSFRSTRCHCRIAAGDAPAEEGIEAAWSEEIKRRIEEIDSGKVQMIPCEEVRRRLAARLADAAR